MVFLLDSKGAKVGIPTGKNAATIRTRFGASASDARANIAPMELGAPQGGSPFADDAGVSDVHVEVK